MNRQINSLGGGGASTASGLALQLGGPLNIGGSNTGMPLQKKINNFMIDPSVYASQPGIQHMVTKTSSKQ